LTGSEAQILTFATDYLSLVTLGTSNFSLLATLAHF